MRMGRQGAPGRGGQLRIRGAGLLVGISIELAASVRVRGRAREQGREREAGGEESRAEQSGSGAQLAGGQASLFRAQLIWLSVGVNAAV